VAVPALCDVPQPFNTLPPKKRKFILEYVKSGDPMIALAEAGYKENRNTALRMLRDLAPYYKSALTDYVKSVEVGILALKVIRDLAERGHQRDS